MASFDLFAPVLMKHEGGFSNHPNDPGGATMKGVTIETYRRHYGHGKTVEDLKNISDSEWKHIMRCYWDLCHADDIRNQSIADILADWTVNAGINAVKKAQSDLGLEPDGIVGPVTLSVLNGSHPENVFRIIQNARLDFYRRLVSSKPSLGYALKGWTNRTNSFKFKM